MKKIVLCAASILVLAIGLISCNSNSPKAVADKFLNSFYHLDYDNARKLSTDNTRKMLDMWQQLLVMIPDSAKQNAKKIKITIKDVKEEGDKATVTYVTSENAKDQTIHMVKEKGKWLVEWSKQDQMQGEGGDNTNGNNPPADQPNVSDTTAAPPANPTATPQSADTAMAK